nr:MAG TPA: hypothetical protein [Caudoviricetes sp.]
MYEKLSIQKCMLFFYIKIYLLRGRRLCRRKRREKSIKK